MEPKKFSHTDEQGKAKMVDVSGKPEQKRTATAEGFISLRPDTLLLLRENKIAKGDVLSVAKVAGIQAAKQTGALIPLCHPLFLSHISVEATLTEEGVTITASVVSIGKTGVEMEALTAVTVALLTIYDMCKAVDKQMVIGAVTLTDKKKENIIP